MSAFIGSISGLVRRQVSSLHAHAGSSGAAYSIVNAAEPVLPVATAVDTDGVNSSDGSASDCDSKDFLLKVRVCSLIDVAGLVYRSALPTILWAEYFATCATIGTVLQVIYLAVKLYDCTWKVKGAAQAIYLFASNTLVRIALTILSVLFQFSLLALDKQWDIYILYLNFSWRSFVTSLYMCHFCAGIWPL